MAIYIKGKGRISAVGVFYIITALASSLTFAFWQTDTYSQFLAFVIYLTSCVLFTTEMAEEKLIDSFKGILKILYMAFLAPFEHIAVPFRSLFKSEKKKIYFQIVIGLVASIPVLCVIIPLLMSSDLAFSGLIKLIGRTFGTTLLKTIFALAMFVFLLSYALVCKFKLKKDMKVNVKGESMRRVPSVPTITFLVIISIAYIVYMFSQLAYFFSAFKGILPEGMHFTLAEYARRGFFETEAIAVINLLIILLTLAFTKRKKQEKIDGAVKGFLTFIDIFSILFIITAISKMIMYVKNYDLTVSRLEVFAFMLITIVFLLAFITKIFNLKVKSIKVAFALSSLFLTVVCLMGIVNTVARYNTNAFLSGQRESIDVSYLSDLGVEAVPSLAKLRASDDKRTSDRAFYHLNKILVTENYLDKYNAEDGNSYIDAKCHKNWRFTMASYLAKKALSENKVEYKKILKYDDEIDYSLNFVLIPYEYEGIKCNSICYNGLVYIEYGELKTDEDMYSYHFGEYIGRINRNDAYVFEMDGKENENIIISVDVDDVTGLYDKYIVWLNVSGSEKDIETLQKIGEIKANF